MAELAPLFTRWTVYSLIWLLHAFGTAALADDLEWHLGQVETGQSYETDLEIRLPGTDGFRIRQARSSCGCLQATIVQAEGSSEQPALLRLSLDTTGIESSFHKYVYLQTNIPDQPLLRVVVRGSVYRPRPEVLRITCYYDPEAGALASVERLLSELQQQYADKLQVKMLDMTDVEQYRRLVALEDRLGVETVAPIELFVEDLYLAGADTIRERLPGLIEALLGLQAPATLAGTDTEVHLYFTPGCRECEQVKSLLAELQGRLAHESPPLRFSVVQHDLSQPEQYMSLVAREEGVEFLSNEPVSVWVGDVRLAGIRQIQAELENTLRHAGRSGVVFTGSEHVRGEALLRRFRSFTPLAVLGAGLLDGINPCAFTTLIFFLSMLSTTGRRRNDLALVGFGFGGAVFITYLLLGLGLLKAFQHLGTSTRIGDLLYYGAAGLALVLAGFSFYDAWAYARTKRGSSLKLQLPLKLKQRIHRVVRSNLRRHHLLIASIVIGVVVSVLESVCTGQVYLPTIALVARDPALRLNAYTYLLLYNLMFLLPLLLVFGLAYVGITSQRIGAFAERRLVTTRLLTSLLYVSLALFVLFGNG